MLSVYEIWGRIAEAFQKGIGNLPSGRGNKSSRLNFSKVGCRYSGEMGKDVQSCWWFVIFRITESVLDGKFQE